MGVTVTATHGHDIITPSSKLTSVSVGDWLRIGNQNGPQFSVIDVRPSFPYDIKSSSPYFGNTNSSLHVFEHLENSYQYILSFGSHLGDIVDMQVESENLVGTDVKAKVTSCNWNIYQKIEITGEALTSGSFYFLYDAEQTVEIPVNSDGASIKSALEDLQTIHTVTIIDESG